MKFQDLKVWQKSLELVKDIYSTTKSFPSDELYGITSQMRRSAVSIPTNIAEGFRRNYPKEYRQFLSIALGSCAELETLIEIACQLKYINDNKKLEFFETIDHICAMIVNLRKKL